MYKHVPSATCEVTHGNKDSILKFEFNTTVSIDHVELESSSKISLINSFVKIDNASTIGNCCIRRTHSCDTIGSGVEITLVRNKWSQFWTLIRLPLLAYAFRAFEIIRKFQVQMHKRSVQMSHNTIMALKLFITYLIAAHWTACFSCFVIFDTCGIRVDDMMDLYAKSFYWTLTTMSTVGFGDINPNGLNSYQTFYAILVMLVGVTLYSGVISFITNILKDAVEASDHNPDHMRGVLQTYMLHRGLDVDIQGRVLEYLDFVHCAAARHSKSNRDSNHSWSESGSYFI